MDNFEADGLRAEMSRIRSQVKTEVAELRQDAKQLTDWRFYVRQYPAASLAAVGALGFLAVPRRLEVMRPDARTLAQLANREQLVVQPRSQTVQGRGWLDTLLTLGGNMLLRAGTAYVGQKVGVLMGYEAASEDHAR